MPDAAFHRIAVATDGSDSASEAVEIAIDLARRYAAELLVIAVAPLPAVITGPSEPLVPAKLPADPSPRYRETVEATIARARAAGITAVTGVCDEGVAVDAIVAEVGEHRCDLLVVGSRGLSAAKRLILGSVSTGLVTHAPCPVLVVRPTTTPRRASSAR